MLRHLAYKLANHLRHLAVWAAIVLGGGAWADPLACSYIFSQGGSSVEIEMDMSKAVLDLLTTSDGTVGGLFPKQELPSFYQKWAQQNFLGQDPRNVDWDLLPDRLKMALLREISARKATGFLVDRKIPNVRVKEKVRLRFAEPTTFLGQSYEAGEHLVDVSKHFHQVEYLYGGEKDVSGVELHLRSDDADRIGAGELVESVWVFQNGIGEARTHLHEHIVAPIPIDALKKNSIGTSLVLAEHHRRANLLAEFISVLQLKESVTSSEGTIRHFDSITPLHLRKVFNYFALGFELGASLKNTLKMGWIGFRGADFYDRPDHFGYEYRALAADADLPLHKKFLNSLQAGLRSGNYGIRIEDMEGWAKSRNVDFGDMFAVRTEVGTIWYKKPYETLIEELPSYLKPILGDKGLSFLRTWILRNVAGQNETIKMLFYDWASDPLFFGDLEAQKKVIAAQQLALNKIFRRANSPKGALKEFIWTSGLLERTAQTFGMSREDFVPTYKRHRVALAKSKIQRLIKDVIKPPNPSSAPKWPGERR